MTISAAFANTWRDEKGRFADKGYVAADGGLVDIDDLDGELVEKSTIAELVEAYDLYENEYGPVKMDDGASLYALPGEYGEQVGYVALLEEEDGTYLEIYDDFYDVADGIDISAQVDDIHDDFLSQAKRTIVFHGTRDQDSFDSIKEGGLGTRNETRAPGANDFVGSAVFTTSNENIAYEYGADTFVFEIDLPQAIADGVITTDNLSREPGIDEAEALSGVAYGYGDDGFNAYDGFSGMGIDPATIIISTDIPPKYLKPYGNAESLTVKSSVLFLGGMDPNALVASFTINRAIEFGNPWRDELGRFAPKGYQIGFFDNASRVVSGVPIGEWEKDYGTIRKKLGSWTDDIENHYGFMGHNADFRLKEGPDEELIDDLNALGDELSEAYRRDTPISDERRPEVLAEIETLRERVEAAYTEDFVEEFQVPEPDEVSWTRDGDDLVLDGKPVRLVGGTSLPDAKVATIMSSANRAVESDPYLADVPVDIKLVPIKDPNTLAFVEANRYGSEGSTEWRTIHLHENYATSDAWTDGRTSEDRHDLRMGSSNLVENLRFTVQHEMAHVSQFEQARNMEGREIDTRLQRAAQTAGITHKSSPLLSAYGHTSTLEAGAEAFAEWANTGGMTNNPIVQAYANEFGWTAADSADTTEFTIERSEAYGDGIIPHVPIEDIAVVVDTFDGPEYQMVDGTLVAPDTMTFANEWRDEIGRFAPKGYTAVSSGVLVADAETLLQARNKAQAMMSAVPQPSQTAVIAHQADALLAREGWIRAGGERRGNSTKRAERLQEMADLWGDGEVMPCVHTGIMLAGNKEAALKYGLEMAQQDKLIVGPHGGGYTIDNLVPSSRAANQSRGDDTPDWLGQPEWGDPAVYASATSTANSRKIALQFQKRRKAIRSRRRDKGKSVSAPKGKLWDTKWRGEEFEPAGPQPEVSGDGGGGGVDADVVDKYGFVGGAVDRQGGDRPGDWGRVDDVGEVGGFGVSEGQDSLVGKRSVPSERFAGGGCSVGDVHGGHDSSFGVRRAVQFANTWRDEMGRFAEKGYQVNPKPGDHIYPGAAGAVTAEANEAARQGIPVPEFDGNDDIYRGIALPVTDAEMAEIDSLLQPAMTLDEVNQELYIGPMLVQKALGYEGHQGDSETSGLGRHWTTDPKMAASVHIGEAGRIVTRLKSRPRRSDIRAQEVVKNGQKKIVDGDGNKADKPVGTGWSSGESEVLLKPNSPVDIVGVEILVGDSWRQVWGDIDGDGVGDHGYSARFTIDGSVQFANTWRDERGRFAPKGYVPSISTLIDNWTVDHNGEPTREAWALKHYGAIAVAGTMDYEMKQSLKRNLEGKTLGDEDLRGFTAELTNTIGPYYGGSEAVKSMPLGLAMQLYAFDSYVRSSNDVRNTESVAGALDKFIANPTYENEQQISFALEENYGITVESAAVNYVNRGWQQSSVGHIAGPTQIAWSFYNDRVNGVSMDGALASMNRYMSSGPVDALNRTSRTLHSTLSAVAVSNQRYTRQVLDTHLDPDATISLHRAMKTSVSKDMTGVQSNPLSSWTTDFDMAHTNFSGFVGKGGGTMTADVPRQHIMSIATVTGMGSQKESEVIVSGEAIHSVVGVEMKLMADDVVIFADDPNVSGPDWIKQVDGVSLTMSGGVAFANPWRDERGRFAPKGSARVGVSPRILDALDKAGERIGLDTVGITKASPEVAEVGWAVREMDELWETEAVAQDLSWTDLTVGLEDSVKTRHVAKVVTGQEPLRDGYPIRVLEGPDGGYVIADGHTRAVMHSLMQTEEIETLVLPWDAAVAAVPAGDNASLTMNGGVELSLGGEVTDTHDDPYVDPVLANRMARLWTEAYATFANTMAIELAATHTPLSSPLTASASSPMSWSAIVDEILADGLGDAFYDALVGVNVEIGFDIRDAVVERTVSDIIEHVRAFEPSIRKSTTKWLQKSLRDGLSVDAAVAALPTDSPLSPRQAYLTARTELIAASNNGAYLGYLEAGVKSKTWITARDERVREPTHTDLEGKKVDLRTDFLVGGFAASYPGDPRLPIQERIQCRCTIVPSFEPNGKKAITKKELYAQAVKREISGRSRMNKPQLQQALAADVALDAATMAQLHIISRARNIAGRYGMRKAELLAAIRAS